MKLCFDGHDEICFDDDNCPLCEAIEKVERLESKVEELEGEKADLESEKEDLDNDLNNLAEEIETLKGNN